MLILSNASLQRRLLGVARRTADHASIEGAPRKDGARLGLDWFAQRSLFEQFRAKRVKVVQEPENHSWAYDLMFADPDGNVLWLGTERRELPLDD